MLGERILLIGGSLLVLFGLACALVPTFFTEQAGISANLSGITDLRAIYGGFQLGLGAFALWCVRRPGLTTAGLVAVGLSLGSIGLVRALGLVIDGSVTAFHLGNLALELSVAALVAYVVTQRRNDRGDVAA